MFKPEAYKKELLHFIAGSLAVHEGFTVDQLVTSDELWNQYMRSAKQIWLWFTEQNALTVLASPVPGQTVFECAECDRHFDSLNDAKNCARTDKQRLWG